MKAMMRVSGAILAVVAVGCVTAGGGPKTSAIDDSEMGLSRTSVFDTPTPQAYTHGEAFPGSSEALPVAYPGAPPQIPHGVTNYLPVTAKNNQCVSCHDNPALIGKHKKGLPTPMPESHYTDLRFAPDKVTKKLIGSRYVCTQCHVPQADVEPLVENTAKDFGR